MTRKLVFSFLSLFLIPVAAYAGTVDVPKTGQTTCYDGWGTVIPCPGTGQDGDTLAGVSWPSPRFANHGDGTVTDNLTGLMWMQNGNYAGDRLEWFEALNALVLVNNGTYENYGHADWRLPNVNELESLVNYEYVIPANWLNTQGFVNAQVTTYYWSSTMNVQFPDTLAWGVRLLDGRINSMPLSGTGDGRNHVWLVRAGQANDPDPNYPANTWKTGQTTNYYPTDDGAYQRGVAWPVPRFTDNGTTVTDNLTGLMWLKNTNCMYTYYPGSDPDETPGDGSVKWLNAMAFVSCINNGNCPNCSGGYSDWRVPNVKELRSLIDYSQANPAVQAGNPFIATGVGSPNYWSSTSNADTSDTSAWTVDLFTGHVSAQLKEGSQYGPTFSVLPVRNATARSGFLPGLQLLLMQ